MWQNSMRPLTNCKEQDAPTHGLLMGVAREKTGEIVRSLILKILHDRLKSLNFIFMKPTEGFIYLFFKRLLLAIWELDWEIEWNQ